MAQRRDILVATSQPANEAAIKRMVGSIRTAMPSAGANSRDSAELVVRLYVSALCRYPEWVIAEACRRFLEGRVAKHNNAFAPTPAELAAECRELAQPARDELHALTKILGAEVMPEPDVDMAARVRAVMRWQKEIRPELQPPPAVTETPEEALARLCKAAGVSPDSLVDAP